MTENHFYSIGQVSEMFGLTVSTLRYYDKEGLFPRLKRQGNVRQFSDVELETLRVIECLKKSGLEIKDIRQFMDWCLQGAKTYRKRHELFVKQKAKVEQQMEHMHRVLDMLRFKCWYYETAMSEGSENSLHPLPCDRMPDDIRRAYLNTHGQSL